MVGELQRVVLTASVAHEGLEAGDVGTVVHVYADGHGLEVEFVALDGETIRGCSGAVELGCNQAL